MKYRILQTPKYFYPQALCSWGEDKKEKWRNIVQYHDSMELYETNITGYLDEEGARKCIANFKKYLASKTEDGKFIVKFIDVE